MLTAGNRGRINGMHQSVGIVEFVRDDYLHELEHEYGERDEQEKFFEVRDRILDFCSFITDAINKSVNDVHNESIYGGVENA